MTKTEIRYIVVNTRIGKPVQNWTFAGKKQVNYCKSADWAMKFVDIKGAQRIVEYVTKMFGERDLAIYKATFTTTVTLAKVA